MSSYCDDVADGRVADVRDGLLATLIVGNLCAGAIAVRHGVRGEPLGVGGSLDVRRPLVVACWGTGLSAPFASLVLAVALRRRGPNSLRALAALFAAGALVEPVFWGRRPCPRSGKALLWLHVGVATTLALYHRPARRERTSQSKDSGVG